MSDAKTHFDQIEEIKIREIEGIRKEVVKLQKEHEGYLKEHAYDKNFFLARIVDDLLGLIERLNKDTDWIFKEIKELSKEFKK